MRRIYGRLCRALLVPLLVLALGGSLGQAQTISDRLVFKVPGIIVAWDEAGREVRGQQVRLLPDPRGCLAFASNTGVDIALVSPDAGLHLRAVSAGRAARPLGDLAGQRFQRFHLPDRTAISPDQPIHQALTVCIFAGDTPWDPASLAASPVELRLSVHP
ncbi:MAG: hypothetical protein AAF253_09405 [Pseudomonadota bacterium]